MQQKIGSGNKMSEEAVDNLKVYAKEHYDINPFSIQWPWGNITKKHQKMIDEDNNWYQILIGVKKVKPAYQFEPAPF